MIQSVAEDMPRRIHAEIVTPTGLRQVIGMRIHRVRRDLGLTQFDFGYKVGANYVMVSRWESGRYLPDAEELFRISILSGHSLDWFYRD